MLNALMKFYQIEQKQHEIMLNTFIIIIIIIIHKFRFDVSLEQNFRAAMCHVLHYSCNVNAAVANSLRCRTICGTVPSFRHSFDH